MIKRLFVFLVFLFSIYILFAQHPFAGGNGTENDPYQITNGKELDSIRRYCADSTLHFILLNNIDLSGYIDSCYPVNGWVTIGFEGDTLILEKFKCKLNGNNYFISGLRSNIGGLIEGIDRSGSIKNLELKNVSINKNIGNSMGVFAHTNSGEITFCSASGFYRETRYSAFIGLVAINTFFGRINFCSNHCDFFSDNVTAIGGIAAWNLGNIYCCYNAGIITDISSRNNNDIGGIAGTNSGTISCSYNIGEIVKGGNVVGVNLSNGKITSCYFDKEKSLNNVGILDDLGNQQINVFGKPTVEMKQEATFQGTCWDFCQDWKIEEGVNYPFFRNVVGSFKINGPDSGCELKEYEYTSGKTLTKYVWDVSSGGTIISGQGTSTVKVVWSKGHHTLKVTDEQCEFSELKITVGDLPQINIQKNQSACNELILDTKSSLYDYKWNTGDTTQLIRVNATGIYWVDIGNQGCIKRDSIAVTINRSPDLKITINGNPCEDKDVALKAVTTANNILWNTGETLSEIKVNQSGYYKVKATENGCSSDDEIDISFGKPSVSITKTGNTCEGEEIILEAITTATDILWNTGSTEKSIRVTESGAYKVAVTKNRCSSEAQEQVHFYTLPEVAIEVEGELCVGNEIILNAATIASDILWNTGSTEKEIKVNSSGEYRVVVTENGCKNEIGQPINFSEKPKVEIQVIGDLCNYDEVILRAITSATDIQWNIGPTEKEIRVKEAGEYLVKVLRNGCENAAKVSIKPFPKPNLEITMEGDLCKGEKVILEARTNATSIRWNTGEENKKIIVEQPDRYWAEVEEQGCVTKKEILVEKKIPRIEILASGDICKGKTMSLTAQTDAENILWNTGSKSATIWVENPGKYVVTAGAVECKANKSIDIICKCNIQFPTAFDPDGIMNSGFGALKNDRIISYNLIIYNRWGTKTFESNSIENRWDGKVKGEKAPVGSYIYVVRYLCQDETVFNENRGTFMLIR